MLGSSRHKSEWHWECSADNEGGHAAPLGEERLCLGSLLSSGIIHMANSFVFHPQLLLQWDNEWEGNGAGNVSWPVSVKVMALLIGNRRIFIGGSSLLVSDQPDDYQPYFSLSQLQLCDKKNGFATIIRPYWNWTILEGVVQVVQG